MKMARCRHQTTQMVMMYLALGNGMAMLVKATKWKVNELLILQVTGNWLIVFGPLSVEFCERSITVAILCFSHFHSVLSKSV